MKKSDKINNIERRSAGRNSAYNKHRWATKQPAQTHRVNMPTPPPTLARATVIVRAHIMIKYLFHLHPVYSSFVIKLLMINDLFCG